MSRLQSSHGRATSSCARGIAHLVSDYDDDGEDGTSRERLLGHTRLPRRRWRHCPRARIVFGSDWSTLGTGPGDAVHRDRRHPSSPWHGRDRSCDDDDKEPYPYHDQGTKTCSAGGDREGGRDGKWHLAVLLCNRARSFPGLRGGLDDQQEDHPNPRGPLQNMDSLLKAGPLPRFRLLSRRQSPGGPLARQSERQDPRDLAVERLRSSSTFRPRGAALVESLREAGRRPRHVIESPACPR